MEDVGGSSNANHLCVLVHGLWGNPYHMRNIAKALRSKYGADELYLLIVKRNSESFTHDGIELGGERVSTEIEEEIYATKTRGGLFTKLSIVGYSLGGLVARYAIGLLHAKGILDTPWTFTTFVTPHLGVRTPLKGWHNHVWNVVGARTLSVSGRQLFMVDKFRDTGLPLLSVMADPKSIFMKGLRKFKRHTAYANVVNDTSSVYYTTGISKTDPFSDMSKVDVAYVRGGEDVIIDLKKSVVKRSQIMPPITPSATPLAILRVLRRLPLSTLQVAMGILGFVIYLLGSVYWNLSSSRRIRLHEKGLAGIRVEDYRMPLWIMEVREEAERTYEALNNTHENEYLGKDSNGNFEGETMDLESDTEGVMAKERVLSRPSEPTLALTPSQFAMIDSLNSVGWRRYPVWIHKDKHSHAAIIVRVDKPTATEGWIVLSHWLEEEFLA
ncbi:hypothetical protein jhhlp_006345 [Lomentospora prolificans]|uniref:DUF676 domain-containing protein n=1 Tax=Lomentospora prolificans TaxID=41688 RepID=A0A2N3N5P2_9PEZI|nr:hypothetical protein jhhlp_006345 [Lomentospora prolificans]